MISEEAPAVIFGCDQTTESECLGQGLFGLPQTFKEDILKTQPGTTVFLFNYQSRLLHGVFQATSQGGFNIKPDAFGQMVYKNGTTGSRFPSQLQVVRTLDAGTIMEQQFQYIIKDNYYHKSKFHPFLNKEQLNKILQLFDWQFEKKSQLDQSVSFKDSKKLSLKINVDKVASGEDDRTHICIHLVPPNIDPLQLVRVLVRCIPGQFDFLSVMKLSSQRGGRRVPMGSYNFFINCTSSKAVQQAHWWLHGNSWSSIWSATTGEYITDIGIKLNLEFARSQGLKELVTMFRKHVVFANGDPKDWTQMPGFRIWLQDYTDPELADEIEYHLNQLRIQQQQQREHRIEESERRQKARYSTASEQEGEQVGEDEEEDVGYRETSNGRNGVTNQFDQAGSVDQDLLLSFDEENSEEKIEL